MTLQEYIQTLPRKQLAELIIGHSTEPIWDYDYDDQLYQCGDYDVYTTSDGENFYDDYESALQHQCWLLAQPLK